MAIKKSESLVSIVIPIYNVERYISNTIDSIINQTYKKIEVILVDDGSNDDSANIAYEKLKNAKISCKLIRQQNQGQGVARNTGTSAISGSWLYFLDSDDFIQPNTIDKILQIAVDNQVDMVITDFQMVGEDRIFKDASYDNGFILFDKDCLQYKFLLRKIVVQTPGTLFNVKWYKENELFFESMRFSEDLHFAWKCLLYVRKVAYVRCPLYNYLFRHGSTMTSSRIDVVIDAYKYFQDLSDSYNISASSYSIKKFLLSRWVLAVVNTMAKISTKEDFNILSRSLFLKNHCIILLSFDDIKVKLAALIALLSPSAYYYAIKLYKRISYYNRGAF